MPSLYTSLACGAVPNMDIELGHHDWDRSWNINLILHFHSIFYHLLDSMSAISPHG